jgi:hypothetical protein
VDPSAAQVVCHQRHRRALDPPLPVKMARKGSGAHALFVQMSDERARNSQPVISSDIQLCHITRSRCEFTTALVGQSLGSGKGGWPTRDRSGCRTLSDLASPAACNGIRAGAA